MRTVGEHHESVTLIQDERRLGALASIHADTVTGTREGWTIAYRVPGDERVALDEAMPVTVVWASGRQGRFLSWRRIGRHGVGIGVGPLPRD
jgi:hypothetical protein